MRDVGDTPQQEAQPPGNAFPMATVRPREFSAWGALWARHATRLWWVTGVCLVVAVGLVVLAVRSRGPQMTVHFQQGHGIKPGDSLRYRGIEVGQVVAVELSAVLDGVDVHVALDPQAVGLARAGSRFWIERPQVSLSRVRGLDTVVGARYIGVLPGPADAPAAFAFTGIETPFTLSDASEVEIVIRFAEGYGLRAGDAAKYRGIVVGEVTAVELDDSLLGVAAHVRLTQSADLLAREGTQFWVERPKISLNGVRGLDTLTGGRYITVSPGPPDAVPAQHFDGLDGPPQTDGPQEGGVEIILYSTHRHGVDRGAPMTYRGLRVGHVVSVGLSADAAHVEARVYIQPAYKRLVRDNSTFWSTSGIAAHFGLLSGVQVDVDTLATIAAGGLSFATPNPPGNPVSTGKRLPYRDQPEDEWLAWEPKIPIGNSLLPEDLPLARPLRASLRWVERTLGVGFKRTRQRQGWILPLDDGRVLGPAELLSFVDGALADEVTLELAGHELPIPVDMPDASGALAVRAVAADVIDAESRWPLAYTRVPAEPEDSLLVTGALELSLPLVAGRMTAEDLHWRIDRSIRLDGDWHGASVLSLRDGKLIGILLVEKKQARVIPISPNLFRQ